MLLEIVETNGICEGNRSIQWFLCSSLVLLLLVVLSVILLLLRVAT